MIGLICLNGYITRKILLAEVLVHNMEFTSSEEARQQSRL